MTFASLFSPNFAKQFAQYMCHHYHLHNDKYLSFKFTLSLTHTHARSLARSRTLTHANTQEDVS